MSNSRHDARDDSALVRTFGVTYPKGALAFPKLEHGERWHQLVYAVRGAMTVTTARGAWVLPPDRALWLPAGVGFSVEASGGVALRTLYLARRLRPEMPREPCVVAVAPLLRELVLHVTERGALDGTAPREARLARVLVDQLEAVRVAPLELPIPTEPTALAVAEWIRRNPAASLEAIEARAGASKRTLERLFDREVGVTLGRFRRRARLLAALRSLAGGASVKEAAFHVGYASASAFVVMFREELGTTPAKYFER